MTDPRSRSSIPVETADRSSGFRLRAENGGPGGAVAVGPRVKVGAVGGQQRAGASGGGSDMLPRLAPAARRVRVPHLLLGALLAIGCATVFFLISLQSSGRVPVLALAQNVSAGHVLTVQDVRVVRVAADADVSTVRAANASSVIGGVMVAPRSAGDLLTPSDVGSSQFPPAGKAVAAVALKAGQFPPTLNAGEKVAALVAASTQSATASRAGPSASWLPGVVVSVDAGDVNSGQTVVSLLMSENDAATLGTAVASGSGDASGSVSVVLLSAGSRAGG